MAKANTRNPRFEVPALKTETTQTRSEPVIRTTSDSSVSSQPQAQALTKNAPNTPGGGATASTFAPTASTPSRAGEQSTKVKPRPEATTTRITESPDEQDPYLVKLAVHLGHELEN